MAATTRGITTSENHARKWTMPTYEYECAACGHEFEKFQSITAKPVRRCPRCGKLKVRRLIGAGAALIFKGSGFYATDYRSEEYKSKAKSEKSESTKSATDSKSSDSKKDSSGDAKKDSSSDAKKD